MATKNIVPNANGEGQLGTSSKSWAQGHIDSITGTIATAAQGSITSLGTLTTLTVDNVIVNGTTIGHTSDTDLLTLADQSLTVAGALTVSGTGNSAFSGPLFISHSSGDSLTLTKDTTEPSFRLEGDSNKDFVITVSGELLTFTQNDGTTDILTLDHDTKNATFGGDMSISGGDLSFSADQDATISMGQRNDGGRNLDIGAGFAGSGGGTNSNGGNLTLRSGGSKGTGTSTMHFRTAIAANGYGATTEQMQIDAAGDVNITNNLFIGSSKAIYLGGTSSPNAFDDYEEGTWDPLPYYQNADDQGKALAAQVTANQTAGFYTKIGNMVHVHGSITWNISDAAGDIAVDNVGVKTLPFASANETNNFSAINFSINGAETIPSGGFTGELSANSTILLISSVAQSGNQGRNLGTGDIIVKFSCSYRATT